MLSPGDAGASPLTALRLLSAGVLAADSEEAVVGTLVGAAHSALAVDQIQVSEISQDAAVSHARVASFEGEVRHEEEYVQVLDERPSGLAQVVASGRPLVVDDARASHSIRRDYVERWNVGSVAFVPLKWADEVRYVLILVRRATGGFTEEEIALAQVMADVAAIGLARHESNTRHAARAARDAALARAARALNESLDLGTVLDTLVREADAAVGGDMAGVYVGDGVRGGVATAGHNTPTDWHGYLMKPGEGVAGQVLATGRPAISNAYQSDVRLPENPGLRRVQTAVAVPMTWGGELKGALSVGFVRMRRVTEEDLRTLGAIADLATVACRNAEAYERARRAAG